MVDEQKMGMETLVVGVLLKFPTPNMDKMDKTSPHKEVKEEYARVLGIKNTHNFHLIMSSIMDKTQNGLGPSISFWK